MAPPSEPAPRLPLGRRLSLAALVATLYVVVGVATYDPTAYDSDTYSPALTVGILSWLVTIVAGGWLLGRNAGIAYAFGVTLLQFPIAILAGAPLDAEGASWWVISAFVSIVFGAVTGALSDQWRMVRVKNAELARKNDELERAGEALARSEAMFREFADRVELGVWISPAHSAREMYINPAGRRMLGIEDGADDWASKVHPDDVKLVEETIAALLHGEPQDFEYRVKPPGHETRWIRSQAFVLADQQGKPVTFTGVLEDVTERKEREAKRELLERRERLSALGTLVAGVAHEVNNPLTYVMGNMELAQIEYAAIAQRHGISAEESQRLERLMTTSFQGSERIGRIVRALRAVTRGREGDVFEDVNLNTIASNVHALIRTSVPASLTMDLSLSSNEPVVRGNSGELHQLLLNLATNAVQAMGSKPGRITIETRIDGKTASLSVRDEGPGIAPEVRARLFTPFFTTKSEGTGLGLSIAHAIVREHDGEVEVESRPGEGALFRVRMPRLEAPAMREVPA